MSREPVVWVDGMLATDLVETSSDLHALDRPGWWAVVGEFEGSWHLARFATVVAAPDPVLALDSLDLGEWTFAGHWASSLNRDEYCSGVEQIRAAIAQGQIYQANLCRLLTAESDQELLGLAPVLARHHPAPFAAYMHLPEIDIVSASPERYFERIDGAVLSTPIKGTAPTPALLSEKDRAENIMIVDLVRHDMAQVTKVGSVTTPRLLEIEEHPGLVHLVSDVRGELSAGARWSDLLDATFPPGSVTGAPKIAALQYIRSLEPVARGPYCGAIGWVSGTRGRLAVGIRTFFQRAGEAQMHFGAGSGITWGSDADAEWEETVLKANRLISLAGGEWS